MIPFSPPRIDDAIIEEVVATLKSGWITTGPRTKKFEKMLTAYSGCQSTLCLNSATAGLEIMLRWFGVGPGDEVIIPAYTYAATANVIIHCGARPVLVDVKDDFNIDPEKVRQAITPRTKVIMPVDFGGWPCDYDRLLEIATEPAVQQMFHPATTIQQQLNRILILADAAHALGAIYKGKRTGSLCDVTVFSFHAVKNLTTAEGGAVALNLPAPFNNNDIYEFLTVFTLHGQNKDALSKMQKGNWKYDIVIAGYKCNMTDIAAAIGMVELNRYDNDTLVRRKRICESYHRYFSELEWAVLPEQSSRDAVSSYHLFPLRIKGVTESQRDIIISKIFEKDISVNVHFIPLPLHTFYRNMGYHIENYPVTFNNFKGEISLPVFYDLTDEMVDTVCHVVRDAVQSVIAD